MVSVRGEGGGEGRERGRGSGQTSQETRGHVSRQYPVRARSPSSIASVWSRTRWSGLTPCRSCAPWALPRGLRPDTPQTVAANIRLVLGLYAAVRAAAGRAIGRDSAGPVSPVKGDKRFNDLAYNENPLFFLLEQQYLLLNRLATGCSTWPAGSRPG